MTYPDGVLLRAHGIQVADAMLPHLTNRALNVQLFTGSRGLRVVVPLRVGTGFDTVRQFARAIAEVVVADDRGLHADRFTTCDVPKRLTGQRDPWADMSRHARSLAGALRRLAPLSS